MPAVREEICRAWYRREHEWVMGSNSGSKESFNVPCHPVCLRAWALGPSAGCTGSNEVFFVVAGSLPHSAKLCSVHKRGDIRDCASLLPCTHAGPLKIKAGMGKTAEVASFLRRIVS